jgi:repressor LexA
MQLNLNTSSPPDRLTPRQMQLLKAIAAFKASRYYSPTIAELASEKCISRTTAFEHLAELRKKGLLSTSSGKARCLELTSKAQRLLKDIAEADADSKGNLPAGIPVAGKIAAGLPLEAVEDKSQLNLDSYFGAAENTFALQVTGDSMINDGIHDGDYVICRPANTADNGRLVVAIVDNENATLKRFYKEKTSVRLQPANDDYQPIYSDNCRIQAVVVGLVRKL